VTSAVRSGTPAISRPPEARSPSVASGTIDALLPVLALALLALTVWATLAVAGDTLGYDFLAYHAAATRVLDGLPAYDTSFEAAGGFGLFYYPPTFIPLVLVFGLLPATAATWAWIGLLLVSFGVGTALLPVTRRTRWLIVLLAAQSWPFVYAIKLGQVGPLLFLLFAAGWRWMDRPGVLGSSGALGAAVKLQPGLVLVWAALTARRAAVAAGAVTLGALALVATLVAGVGSWADFALLIGRVSDPITTPHNVTPGAIAFQLGMAPDTASLVQWGAMTIVAGAVVLAALRLPSVPSYLVAVVASQLLSPILWDHYALLLLLPVAWLVSRGHWWAIAIPLATSLVLVGLVPAWVYPVAFGATIVGLFAASPQRGEATT